MDIESLKKQNEAKTREAAERGPVESRNDAAPIGNAIRAFRERCDLPFAIPAHRPLHSGVRPDAAEWLGDQAFIADVAMTHGADTRDQAWGVHDAATDLFAKAVGADEVLFSTNGSTENVHVAMMAAIKPGETLVMARNGHKSAFSGLVLSGAMPVYADPVYDSEWQVAHGVEAAEVERVLSEHPEARAVMLLTPTYYGVSADVAAIAEVVHGHGVPLIVDAAWGLDYSFCSRLPRSALDSGADLAIGSVHKSLSGLCQTSVLSRKGERVDPGRLSLVFELTQSTSASTLLAASIDGARRQFQRDGERILSRAIDLALSFREMVRSIDGLRLMETDIVGGPGVFDIDPTHVCIDVVGLGITGYSAADWLIQHRGIHIELSDHRRLMPLITFADTEGNIGRLLAGLRDLARASDLDTGRIPDVPDPADLRMETVMLPRDAFLGVTEMVPWRQAAGRISAEMICPYPPGIPIAAPGERLTAEAIDYLEQVVAAGGVVEGAADTTLEEFRVVAG